MSTEIISLKDYRKNLSQIWKRSQKENIQVIVMVHSEPVFKVTPIEKNKDKYSFSLKELEKRDFEFEKATKEEFISFKESSYWKDWVEVLSFLSKLK